MKQLLLYFSVIFLFMQSANAQPFADNDDDDPYEHVSYFMFGMNYLSNNVYLGRKDSTRLPYVSPYIGYHNKTGLFIKTMASYAPTKKIIDLVTIEAGYDHSFGEHINAGVNVDRFFYNKNSLSIRSNTKGCAGIFGQYSNNWIEPQITFDANFNKKSTDYVLNFQLDHNFCLANNTLNIIPTAAMNSGTQHYYDEYFVTRLTKNDKTVKVKKVVANANKFNPLDYEFSTKVTYRITKWLFTLIPTYAIPVSPAQITLPATKNLPERTYHEKLSNSFYVELDICHM